MAPGIDEFEPVFPLPPKYGKPISRQQYRDATGGIVTTFGGGPVDLKDPAIIMAEVASRLKIRPYSEATQEEAYIRRTTDNIKGIIYETDKTYRYFVWFTVGRKYCCRLSRESSSSSSERESSLIGEDGSWESSSSSGESSGRSGKAGMKTFDKIAKVPFLVWMGSSMSFLSFETINMFFTGAEVECQRYSVDVDGVPFLFNGPKGDTGFKHYNILGRDFMESRFKTFQADYTTLTVQMRRRRDPVLVSGQQPSSYPRGSVCGVENQYIHYESVGEKAALSSKREELIQRRNEEWVKRRDEDLERYLEEDEDEEYDDGDAREGKPERMGGVSDEESIDPRLLVWDADQEMDRMATEQLKAEQTMEKERERVPRQIAQTGSVIREAHGEVELGAPGANEEDKRKEETAEASFTEVIGRAITPAGPSRPINGVSQSRGSAEDGGSSESGSSDQDTAEPQITLPKRKASYGQMGLAAVPTSSPVSRKEGKRSGSVSEGGIKVSGSRTGSGMRR
ncbi:hypothetical protein TWF481_002395 [Arthrobotrys musiformis]|uniref:Uncharacterized protein n=1 Tax=Arthrobotrys musiformis TaxID=47236 RepID=A0AAV9VT27_9PEZI